MLFRPFRRVLCALLLSLGGEWCVASTVFIAREDNLPADEEWLVDALGGGIARALPAWDARYISPDAAEQVIAPGDVVVALGATALEAISLDSGRASSAAVIGALVSRSSYETLRAEHKIGERVTAVFSDPSPRRQIALIRVLLGEGAVTGVIHSPAARRDVDEAMRAAGAFGITLGAVDIGSYQSAKTALASFTHARALLLFKDPPLLQQAPLDTLLLLAYDMHGMGVVGYASGVVENGALATTYASVDDTVRSVAALITEIQTTGVVPAAAHGRYFSVSVNRYVMRSLGIRERDAREIKMSVDALLAGDTK